MPLWDHPAQFPGETGGDTVWSHPQHEGFVPRGPQELLAMGRGPFGIAPASGSNAQQPCVEGAPPDVLHSFILTSAI